MGIKDLLKFMKPYIVPIHISKYAHKRVGIDAYSWLHKGAYACSMELALNTKGEKGKRYLKYFMHHINLLRHYSIIPVVVFDGGIVPCKSDTASERRKRRDENLVLAKENLDRGNVNAAIELFQKAIRITPAMSYQLIQILRMENIEFLVAPYEADSQLAYMSTLEPHDGGISAVITEDSDLMAYGCQAVIFKMDRYGNAEEILIDSVFNSSTDGPPFNNFDMELFTGMCVLAGCDFLPSVPDIGIKRAYSLVSKYRNLDRVLSVLKFQKGKQMPEDYAKSFKKAIAVFRHALIYDAGKKTLRPMVPLSEKVLEILDGDLDILGEQLPQLTAVSIAEGRLNPITKEPFENIKCNDQMDIISTPTSNYRYGHDSKTSRDESCFTFFSASETSVEEISGREKENVGTVKYSHEAVALGKLLFPVKCRKLEERLERPERPERKEFPNNNPFKKRKLENSDEGAQGRVAEQVSIVTTVESGIAEPSSQETVDSRPLMISKIDIDRRDEKSNTSKSKSGVSKRSSITNFFMRAAT